MKSKLIFIALFLVLSFVVEAKKPATVVRKKAAVCLTLQAENGSVKQKINEDGSITCIIKSTDLIRVSTILLNGEDITSQLEKNKLNLPMLTKDATLEISFEEPPVFAQPTYNTIAMF